MPVVARTMGQMGGGILLIGVFFLALSVSSYSPDDPTWNYYVSQGTGVLHNRGGSVGAVLADWGLQAFGSTVICLAGIGGLGAWWLLWRRPKAAWAVFWRGGLIFAAVSGSLSLLFTRDPILGPALLAGGIGGKWLADVAVENLDRSGAYAAFALSIVVASCVGVGLPWRTVLGQGLQMVRRGGRVLGERLRTSMREVGHTVRAQGGETRRRVGALTGWVRFDMLRRSLDSQSGGEKAADLVAPLEMPEDVPARPGRTAEVRRIPAPVSLPVVHEPAQRIQEPAPIQPLSPPTREEEETDLPLAAIARRPLLQAPVSPNPTPEPPVMVTIPEAVSQRAESAPQPPPSRPLSPEPGPVRPEPQVASESAGAVAMPKIPRSQRGVDVLPSLDVLDMPGAAQRGQSPEELDVEARFLEQKLREFGVDGEVVQVLPGPVITMFEFAPAAGVKVNKIVNLQDDLALVMRALSVRVVAPIPGKAVVGIEVPHKHRETVRFHELLDSEEFRGASSKLTLALGKDILGRPVVTDLALIPHLLIAGATGSGKSVGLNSLICSLLFRATPADVKMIMIDPKMLEFSVYDGVPHLLVPVVTDPKKAAVVLRRVVEEMTRRYQLLAAKGVRSIAQYNQALEEESRYAESAEEKLPYLVVVIDELSDLMMVSAREVEDSLMRLAQMARAAGIHLIVATQRPSVDVLTGVIKANFPARLSFQVTSKVDSRTILDMNGAETLLGRGDMLFLAPGTSKPQRVHGAYVSEAEIGRLVTEWKALAEPQYDDSFVAPVGQNVDVEDDEYDEKYDEGVALVTKTGQASISMLQRRLRVGYNRAARMIEMMEKEGIVGPADGIKPREVLIRNAYDD